MRCMASVALSMTESFRTEIYPEYKANRDPAPPELKRQFEQCRRFVRALGVMEHSSPAYEADDLIGTLVHHGREKGRASTIVTRDKDLTQLLTKQDIFWDYAGKGKLGYQEIPGSFGVWPEQIADFLALAGDAVDNIKGVPGVGKKTATGLLEHFGSLDEIYANLDRVHEVNVRGAKTLAAKLDTHKEDAYLARQTWRDQCFVRRSRNRHGAAAPGRAGLGYLPLLAPGGPDMPDWSPIYQQLYDEGVRLRGDPVPTPVSGGDISAAWRLATDDGDLFMKTGPLSAVEMFAAEAEGLSEIAQTGTIHVPQLIASGATGTAVFLALEWLDLERADAATAPRNQQALWLAP